MPTMLRAASLAAAESRPTETTTQAPKSSSVQSLPAFSAPARSMVGIYASSMPAEQLERNGVDPDSLKPIIEAIGGGDLAKGVELTTPEIADKLSFAGTPEEVTAKIKEIEPAGVNHLIAALTDASLVKAFTGRELPGVATVEEQLRLLHDEVMPAFS